MSVLIEGMGIPKAQFQKISTLYHVEGTIFVYPDGKAKAELSVDYNERKSYPIIPVPEPMGRLVNADDIFVEIVIEGQKSKRYKLGEKWELNGEEIRSVISRLPTIIPASKEKKNEN